MKKMDEEFQTFFNHDDIVIAINWGTDEENNNVQVTFYQYDVANRKYSELKNMSNKVKTRLISNYPKFKKLNFIETRFTEEENKDDNSSFVTFKHTDLK
jgi:hypothetical protein